MTAIQEDIKNNPSAFPQVKYNPNTRETTAINPGTIDENGNTSRVAVYDLNAYAESPSIVGTDDKGNTILRYEKQPKYRQSNSGTTTYFKDVEKGVVSTTKNREVDETGTLVDEDYRYINNANRRAEFEKNNPDQLYITVKRTNYDPIADAQENYIDLTVSGLNSGDSSKGIEIIEQQRR